MQTVAVMGWLQDHLWVVVGVIVAAALVLAGLVWWSARQRPPATSVPGAAARRRVDLTFAAAVLVTLAAGWAAVLWLLAQADQVPAGKDRAAARAEAVKTGATIALGTGGAAYLLLAYRRQRLEEVDTRERRITELFTKAVEELGHEKAPVRLGALYSLQRLAQNNPEHRQTVVDVFCAYLRMPYTPPARSNPDATQVEQAVPPDEDGIPAAHPVSGQDPAQELQVRQTAQHILADHLRLPEGTSSKKATKAPRRRSSPGRGFWPGISLDLTGTALVDFDFRWMSVVQARFDGASFQGRTNFAWASFQGDARFDGAKFQDGAGFSEAAFQGYAGFNGATFQGYAGFNGAAFQGAGFRGAAFQGIARFDRASFQGDVNFDKASFQNASFDEATFHGSFFFQETTFEPTSPGDTGVAGAQVLRLDIPVLNELRLWPDGYIVCVDRADRTRGTLVHAEDKKEPEPNVPPVRPRPINGSGTS